jgi:autotransporter passenger strand-loop-strand repeat protein
MRHLNYFVAKEKPQIVKLRAKLPAEALQPSQGVRNIPSSGQTYPVSSGQIDSNDLVLSGGSMNVLSGGIAGSTTISDGGFEIVAAGGTDLIALISGGSVCHTDPASYLRGTAWWGW